MKVLNLRCANDHAFEGWFGSEAEFADQRDGRRIACPVCTDQDIQRMPTAPRLNLSGSTEPAPAVKAAPTDEMAQAAWLLTMRHLIASTEDVGERFAHEARSIHYGESQTRGIRGQVSEQERESLREEGIEVATLVLPPALKEPLQ